MKVIINKLIPMKGYIAMTVYPFIFARKELDKYTLNHENIHGEQQKELLTRMEMFDTYYDSLSEEQRQELLKIKSDMMCFNWFRKPFPVNSPLMEYPGPPMPVPSGHPP